MTCSVPVSSESVVDQELHARAARIRLAVFDVDGVLTDGRLYYSDDGRELKSFHVRDGLGLKRLMKHGIEVAIITARMSSMVTRRAAELGIAHVYQDQQDKLACLKTLLHALDLPPEAVAYAGDDLPDLAVMQHVGLAATVADGHHWVRERAHWQSANRGGQGAVRELCDLILSVQGHDDEDLAALLGAQPTRL